MRPIILVTCTAISLKPGQGPCDAAEADTSCGRREGLLTTYTQSVVQAGGSPLLLPNCPDAEVVEAAVAATDGLLLTGGGDVDASLYGQANHPTMGLIDPLRDRAEQQAIGLAMRLRKPILGICRGIQILNVVLGGTLIQDIPSYHAVAGRAGSNHQASHGARIEPKSLLAMLWNCAETTFNSSHHQAVDRLAPSLRAIARAPDGIVEAVQSNDGYPLLALQCHPERLAHAQDQFLAVFQWLVQQATE